jgi:uncharacterized repeat protein (TIGR03803 family)
MEEKFVRLASPVAALKLAGGAATGSAPLLPHTSGGGLTMVHDKERAAAPEEQPLWRLSATLHPRLFGVVLFTAVVFLPIPVRADFLVTLAKFNGSNGAEPVCDLIRDSTGNFYGTTSHGGASDGGTVFKLSPNGKFTTLVNFNGSNGANPQPA